MMMKWQVPAKTFLLGEYAAIAQESAIVLTTQPCFELSLHDTEEPNIGIHPNSPAGLWWQQKRVSGKSVSWYDPYQGCGGLGASSAQFIACYWASCLLHNETPTRQFMLDAYYQCAWSKKGLKPSGYDVIAQTQQGAVYINQKKQIVESYPWPFTDLSFILIHTDIKLATHHHLEQKTDLPDVSTLSLIVDQARMAFNQANSALLLECINEYQKKLTEYHLVASHSLELIQQLKKCPEILAVKGCGALGADVILILTSKADNLIVQEQLHTNNRRILGTVIKLHTAQEFVSRNLKANEYHKPD